jgi:hypothetical protein
MTYLAFPVILSHPTGVKRARTLSSRERKLRGEIKMIAAVGEGSRSQGRDYELAIVGGFGWPEKPRQTKTCSQDDCVRERIVVTDLYCDTHDRFLPFVRDWSNTSRVMAIVTGAAVIYASFTLAAQLNSWLPLFAVYALIGLATVGLPLRLFPLTVRVAILIWLLACAVTLTYHLTGANAHTILITAIILAAMCGLGLHIGMHSVQVALDEKAVNNEAHRPRAVLALVTGAFTISAALSVAGLSLVLVPRSLSVDAAQLTTGALIAAVTAFAVGWLVAAVAGFIHGAPRISMDTAAIRSWRGWEPVNWRAARTALRQRQIRSIVDRMGDVLRRAVIRLADALRISSVASARTAANFLMAAVRILVNILIRGVNFILKLIIIVFRAILAGLASAWWFSSSAVRLTILYLLYAIAVAGLPTATLFIAAACTSVAAGQTLRYLIYGSLVALLQFGSLAVLGIAALATAWITLASQRLNSSLRSARRSASITAPYWLLLVATGGWIVGLPGTLGHGRIHVGWVTLISTGALAIAFVWSQFINKPRDESEAQGVVTRQA